MIVMTMLRDSLARWDQWLATHAPLAHAQLQPGTAVGAPDELATLWAWHAGQTPEPAKTAKGKPVWRPVLASGSSLWSLLTPADAATLKDKLDTKLARGGFDTTTYTTKLAWHPRWQPFAVGSPASTILVIDPEGCFSGGTPGQVIAVETSSTHDRELHAPSLLALIDLQLAAVEAGGLVVDAKKALLKINSKNWDGIAGYPKRKNLDKAPRASTTTTTTKLLDIVKERMSRSEVEAAIAAGASLDVTANGLAPIHLAAQSPSTGPLEALLAAGAAVETRDAAGRTPLAIAVEIGRPRDAIAMISVLCAHGASPDTADANGQTPRMRAARRYDANGAGAEVLAELDRDHAK